MYIYIVSIPHIPVGVSLEFRLVAPESRKLKGNNDGHAHKT
jgi:hypothetical protein